MNCPNCNAERNGNESVCELCGYQFEETIVQAQDSTSSSHLNQPIASPSEQKNSKGLIAVIVILIIAVLGMGGFLIYLFLNPGDKSDKGDDTISATENIPETTTASTELSTETSVVSTENGKTESISLETTVPEETIITTVTTETTMIVESTSIITESQTETETETELVTVEPTEIITEIQRTGYAEAYLPLIQQAAMVDKYAQYCIYDIDADGINEIIIGTNLGGAMGLHQFFTLKDGAAAHCGEIAGSGYLLEESGNLYYETASWGYQEINQVQTFGNSLYMTRYFASDEMMTEYLDFGTDLTYYYTTEIDPVYALDN